MTSPFLEYAILDFPMFDEEDIDENMKKKRIKYAMFALFRLPALLDNRGSMQPSCIKIHKRCKSSQLNKFAGILMHTTCINRKVRFSPKIRKYHYKGEVEESI